MKAQDMVTRHIKSLEQMPLILRTEKSVMRAIPSTSGRWQVTYMNDGETKFVRFMTNTQLVTATTYMIENAEHDFCYAEKRDNSGYIVGAVCYESTRQYVQTAKNTSLIRKFLRNFAV
jgi:hypothetical protein